MGPPTDDPELLEQFDGNLEDADASASQVYASESRSFQEARELLSRVKSARGYFLVGGTGALDGLVQPSTDRKPAKSLGKGKKGKRKGKTSSYQGGKVSKPWYTWTLAETGTIRGGPHHAPRLRPDQCMLCRQVGHRASECPNTGKATSFSRGKRSVPLVPTLWAVLCSVPCVTVQQSKKTKKIKTRMTSNTLLLSQSRALKSGYRTLSFRKEFR